MKVYVNKYNKQGNTAEDKIRYIEDYLVQFSNNVIDALSNRLTFEDNFQAVTKQIEVRGSGEYIVLTNTSQSKGGIIRRNSANTVINSFSFRVEGDTVKLIIDTDDPQLTLLDAVIFL